LDDNKDLVYKILVNLKSVQHEIKSNTHQHFKEMNITAPQGMLLYMLGRHGSLKITKISEKMGLSNSTVSGIVDRLESQGFVKRVRSESDRRVVNVEINDAVKEKLNCHESILEEIMTEAIYVASEEELSTVASGLDMLSELLQRIKKEK